MQQQRALWRGIRRLDPQVINSPASGDRRHYRNSITVRDCGSVFLKIADVFIVEINIHKRPKFTLIRVKMTAQVRMLGDEVGKGIADGAGLDVNRRLLASVLAKGGGDLDLGHRLYMMPQEG
jgi:hypothetical protein